MLQCYYLQHDRVKNVCNYLPSFNSCFLYSLSRRLAAGSEQIQNFTGK